MDPKYDIIIFIAFVYLSSMIVWYSVKAIIYLFEKLINK